MGNKPLPKEGQKTEPTLGLASPSPVPKQELDPLLTHLTDLSQPLTDDDLRIAGNLHPAAAGSIEEAVLITAQLRMFRQQLAQSGSFQSRDLYPGEGQTTSEARNTASLEKLFQDLEVDLPRALQSNPALQNVNVMKLVQELLNNTQNSTAFQGQMTVLLAEQSQKWPELAEAPPSLANADPASTTPAVASSTTPAATDISTTPPTPDSKATPTDLKRSDAILLQAQKFADKGDFKQAIELTARIDNQDPFHEQAREKIRVFSNRAVQDLRQRAALAFQNALPMSDSRAKQAYLLQAQGYLENALRDFPAADQLDTVKDNLAVIKRDLDTIAKETASESSAKTQ